jgi:nucleoside-diphosphate-sugar epimerase
MWTNSRFHRITAHIATGSTTAADVARSSCTSTSDACVALDGGCARASRNRGQRGDQRRDSCPRAGGRCLDCRRTHATLTPAPVRWGARRRLLPALPHLFARYSQGSGPLEEMPDERVAISFVREDPLNSNATTAVRARVVVTGAAGFIASHLVDALLAAGHEVIALDRRSVDDDGVAAANLAQALGHDQLRLHCVDLATDDLHALVAGATTVFHLAGLSGVRGSWGARFGDYVTANILATNRLLGACEQAGARRLVFASSSSVYGTTRGPSREDDPTGPISPYGVSKLAAEQLCLAHAGREDTALSVAALRYFTVYGPRQRPDMAIGRVLLAALTGIGVPLFGDGRQRREFTYVDDVVAATVAAATAEVTAAVINVGGGSSVSMLDVVEMATAVTGRPVPIVTAATQAGDVAVTEADLSLARRMLGYRPRVGLREGMDRHARWLAAHPASLRMSLLSTRQLEVTL